MRLLCEAFNIPNSALDQQNPSPMLYLKRLKMLSKGAQLATKAPLKSVRKVQRAGNASPFAAAESPERPDSNALQSYLIFQSLKILDV